MSSVECEPRPATVLSCNTSLRLEMKKRSGFLLGFILYLRAEAAFKSRNTGMTPAFFGSGRWPT